MNGTLIVNADDFGLTPGVSHGIVRGYREGVITSTSMLAIAPAFDIAVALASSGDTDDLGVGAHLALVGEDPPLLGAKEIPSLVDARGNLAASWRVFLRRAAVGAIDEADIRRELSAQLDRLAELGRPLTHIDTHQHLHLWPVVRNVALPLAVQSGIPAVRVPWSRSHGPIGLVVRRLARALRRQADALGLLCPGAFLGLDEAGSLDETALLLAVGTLGAHRGDSVEIGCHPGEAVDPDRSRYAWDYRWEAELAGLTSHGVRHAIAKTGFELGNFATLRRCIP